eukprot:565201-Alexandrium_andersonii.AAC.1
MLSRHLLVARGTHSVSVSKVKAHLTLQDVHQGAIDFDTWRGNARADQAARRSTHGEGMVDWIADEITTRRAKLHALVLAVQSMIGDVLLEYCRRREA